MKNFEPDNIKEKTLHLKVFYWQLSDSQLIRWKSKNLIYCSASNFGAAKYFLKKEKRQMHELQVFCQVNSVEVYMSVWLCLVVCLCVSLAVSGCLSVCQSGCVWFSVLVSVWLCLVVCLCVSLAVSVCLSVCQSGCVWLSVLVSDWLCLVVCLYASLSACVSDWLWNSVEACRLSDTM